MASEYLLKKYKDVKPDKPRELTKAEKRKNWWHYHKRLVVVAVVLVLAAANLVWSILGRDELQPDYQLAYVGAGRLPDDTVDALETAIASMGEDLNSDGQVLVKVQQYISSPDGDPSQETATGVQIMADVMEQTSFLFLMDDPESFQQRYRTLSLLDGTLPEEDDYSVENSVLIWGDCPVLAGLELGDYSYDLFGETVSGNNQDLLSRLFIGRRGFWAEEETELQKGNTVLWGKLIEGAVS